MKRKKYEDISCNNCQLTHLSVFKHLTQDELDVLNFEKGCNHYKRGNIIFHEGNKGNGVYCIYKGVVKLYKTGIDGREQIIRFAKDGDIIGFRSVLSNESACSTAKAINDVSLCFIPAKTFYTLVQDNRNFSLNLIQLSCKELGEANKFILDLAQKNVRERLAEVLLLLDETFGRDKDNVLQINLTREEIANIVGTATESTIRLLSEFKKDKLIELNGRNIKILKMKELQRISDVY